MASYYHQEYAIPKKVSYETYMRLEYNNNVGFFVWTLSMVIEPFTNLYMNNLGFSFYVLDLHQELAIVTKVSYETCIYSIYGCYSLGLFTEK